MFGPKHASRIQNAYISLFGLILENTLELQKHILAEAGAEVLQPKRDAG